MRNGRVRETPLTQEPKTVAVPQIPARRSTHSIERSRGQRLASWRSSRSYLFSLRRGEPKSEERSD